MPPYLTPVRRAIELLVAGYGAMFGMFVWVCGVGGHNVVAWAGLDLSDGGVLARVMVFAGLAHAAGVRINGSWRWSPFLRLTGLFVHVGALGWLAWNGVAATSTAAFTYGFILVLFAGVLWFVAGDCAAAIGERRKRGRWKNI